MSNANHDSSEKLAFELVSETLTDNAPTSETIVGTVISVIFAAPDGGYAVFGMRPKNSKQRINVTVCDAAPLIGQEVRLSGEWVTHPRFGDQFKADTIRVTVPGDAEGIERFLASGAIDGVGPALAKTIVGEFGEDTLNIIENEPHKLERVRGIGKKTASKIADSYRRHSELKDIMLWLQERGVSGIYAARIFKTYSSNAIEVMSTNPYRLIEDINGIGFVIADTIAKSNGLDNDSYERIAAGLTHTLNNETRFGHCCLPYEVLVEKTAKLLNVNTESVYEVYSNEAIEGRLITEDVGELTAVYPPFLYYAESVAARRLLEIKEQAMAWDDESFLQTIDEWECGAKMTLADGQKQAVAAMLANGVFILTGGPGTGKTTVLRCVIDMMEKAHLTILLGAPTGRAAKRLHEATGRKAMTVHRMLEAQVAADGSLVFAKNADNPLDADVIILDEVSMLDIVLMRRFTEAVPFGAHIILVGDADQLPSVGQGAVLHDMLCSKVFPHVRLNKIFRQGEGSGIVLNAHAINQGRMPQFNERDFVFVEMSNQEQIAAKIVELCAGFYAGLSENHAALNAIQVLSPMHRLPCGVSNMNLLLQKRLNPPTEKKPEITVNGQIFRLGDKVMQTKNNYQKKVFNGDIGFINDIEDKTLTVRFADGITAEYEKGETAELSLAYAMSVHKSQGGEYSLVIMPLVRAHSVMLQRNLLYTAVTRAKQKVIIIGEKNAIASAVANDRTKRRFTLFAERLTGAICL